MHSASLETHDSDKTQVNMSIFAIADLHLAFGKPDKTMEEFGWHRYTERIEESWRELIKPQDLVLIAGDISWSKAEADALKDLEWIDKLPGTKLILRGNHDYWWSSLSKVKKMLPPSLKAIQNDSFTWEGFSIGGTRLWDTDEYDYSGTIDFLDNPKIKKLETPENPDEQERIFLRELHRLELSLQTLKPHLRKIAMTHYPPIGPDMLPSRASTLLEKYGVEICVFGHLHNVKKEIPLLGTVNGVRYTLTAADYINFVPIQIA